MHTAVTHSLTFLRRWLPWPVPALSLPALLIFGLGPDVEMALRYERAAIFGGDFWRLVSGHFVHLGGMHLVLNLLALWLIMVGCGGPGQPPVLRTVIALLVLLLGVSAGLLLANPHLDWYVGLSGVLHGLLILVAVWSQQDPLRWVLVAGTAAKVGWEQFTGGDSLTGQAIGGTVVVDAHLYGFLSAAGLVAVEWLCKRVRSPKSR